MKPQRANARTVLNNKPFPRHGPLTFRPASDRADRPRRAGQADGRQRADSEAALRELYDLTSSRLYGVALRVVTNREWAEDVLQEAYLNIWRIAGNYREALSPPMAWLGVIVRSRALDFLRRRASERADSALELDDLIAETVAGDAAIPWTAAWPANMPGPCTTACAARGTPARSPEPGLPARPEPHRVGATAQAAAGYGEDLDPARPGAIARLHGRVRLKRPAMNLLDHPELADRLAAAYGLGTLRGGARRRFEAQARKSPALRAAALAWQERFAGMTELQPGEAPSPNVWKRIEIELAQQRPSGAACAGAGAETGCGASAPVARRDLRRRIDCFSALGVSVYSAAKSNSAQAQLADIDRAPERAGAAECAARCPTSGAAPDPATWPC